MRGATGGNLPCRNRLTFQSTHPVRGATDGWHDGCPVCKISIHAPRAGCDYTFEIVDAGTVAFQSTHPVRGATVIYLHSLFQHSISIHAPRAGCDYHRGRSQKPLRDFNPRTPCGVRHVAGLTSSQLPEFQSTHPVRGATRGVPVYRVLSKDFNPRTPCGVRQELNKHNIQEWIFQSTHPVRGATYRRIQTLFAGGFQSTHPVRGATICVPLLARADLHFNPRTPCGVRQLSLLNVFKLFRFQSTHPVRGATCYWVLYFCKNTDISIHAPRAGCDLRVDMLDDLAEISIHAPRAGCDFGYTLKSRQSIISIHAPRAGCDHGRRR